MRAFVEQIKQTTQLRWNKVHKFSPKINLHMELGPYILKTAESLEELIQCFRLRYEVFHQEFQDIESEGLDVDRFDSQFDHLIVVHKSSGRLIGTYRLRCSAFSRLSYTALEFDLSFDSQGDRRHLELGRACIHREYRKGAVISLLWRGIAEYMKLSGSDLLYGCSSLKVNTARDAALVYRYFQETQLVSQEFVFSPTKRYRMKDLGAWLSYFNKGLSDSQAAEAQGLVPGLLKSYLKLGAEVASEPAFDEEFDCIDFLTVLRKENLAKSLADKYQIA